MTVESNYVIAIATLNDWLKRLAPVFQPMRIKTDQNQSRHVRVIFPALQANYSELLGIVIGSSRCLAPVVIGRSNFGFGFFDCHLKPLYPLDKFQPKSVCE